jgi:predicted CoA-substrate-specific enzyme activase
MTYVMGIDAGSTYSKGVLMNDDREIVAKDIILTGANINNAAETIRKRIFQNAKISEDQVKLVVGTGYGRYIIKFGNVQVTEISCHARGANHLFPNTRTVLDVGGQDMKVIKVNERGNVLDFVMNDKCAAGTGRFVETIIKSLKMDFKTANDLALKSRRSVTLTSTCTVFAENEVREHLVLGDAMEDILNGVFKSVMVRAVALIKRVGMNPELTFTGGLSLNPAAVKTLEEFANAKVNTSQLTVYAGAIGAAIYGLEKLEAEAKEVRT